MCGIVGFWQKSGFSAITARLTATKMASRISHRGPDDSGVWVDAEAGIAIAHRRLSILDLSPAGHQPMISVSGRYIIVFNGEIYNHCELRRELDQPSFRQTFWTLDKKISSQLDFISERREGHAGWQGHSDTESLLAGFDAWGIEVTLKKTVGMFALALWDNKKRVLTLARDRMGEKPLYYGWQGDSFLFASELKALKPHSAFCRNIDRDALALLLKFGYIPTPWSIYAGIRKLPPGTYLQIPVGRSIEAAMAAQPQTYWSLRHAAETGLDQPFLGDDTEAIRELEERILAAVRLQQIADVPLGAFLSGGVDSSTIVALMQAQSASPVHTFTIGFNETSYNEADYAKKVAAHLGTYHTELYVTTKAALDVIHKLPLLFDEPFADPSQIPTFLVAELSRRYVTVALSGDAGDELFGGYNRYIWGERLWQKVAWMPSRLRYFLAHAIGAIPVGDWDKVNALIQSVLPLRLQTSQLGNNLHKFAQKIDAFNDCGSLHYELVTKWRHPEFVVIGSTEQTSLPADKTSRLSTSGILHNMMFYDAMTYLPDDILVKVDRTSMGNSLESRMPLLDHRIVEFAWCLPSRLKIRHGQGKWILRQILHKYVPKELVERPKMGFSVPIDQWLRDPLREWAQSLLSPDRLQQEGYFQPLPILQRWRDHLSGVRNWQDSLWSVLMFQAWLDSG